MRRIASVVDTRDFWVVVAIIGVLSVFAYSYANGRADTARNKEAIVQQASALSYLCETVRILDSVYVQTIAVDAQIIASGDLPASVVKLLHRRIDVLQAAHFELADTRACKDVE